MRITFVPALFAFVFCFLTSLNAPTHSAPHLSIDLDSGRVLSHEQAFDAWHPASLAKLMTAWVVFREIERGVLTPESPVRISKTARKQPPSRMGYRTGTVLTVENALALLVVKSANDIAVALAETAGGSAAKFAAMMNREAQRLGMTGSRFTNPHGLHDRRQVTTARDMALLVRAIHKTYPQYINFFRSASILAPQRTKNGKTIQRIYYSYNLLLERFRGGDGFKTGFVCASGYNFIGSATRAGRRIAAVVLGRNSQTSRAVDAAKLITEGFQLPNAAGTPIAELKPGAAANATPRNMRPQMCSEAARAARYEPGAGQAVIDSPWLSAREIVRKPIKVTLGGASNALSPARIPLPSFRPEIRQTIAANATISPPIKESSVQVSQQNIVLPTFRPGS
ncbi:MAG: D-alanyl-D-alanine carboxypeptidase family protein [Rhizobiaceae bacterium]